MQNSAFAAEPCEIATNDAITLCLQGIRARYLSAEISTQAGAFRMTIDFPNTADIDPYFALEGVLGVLAAHSRDINPDADDALEDLKKVGNFLLWYAKNIQLHNRGSKATPYGVAHEFDGSRSNPPMRVDDPFVPPPKPGEPALSPDVVERQTWAYDSIDSYAGLFLLACARYLRLQTNFPAPATGDRSIEQAIVLSVNALDQVIHNKNGVIADEGAGGSYAATTAAAGNGLTIARGRGPVHYALDNAEAHAGLIEIAPLVGENKISGASADPGELANGIVTGTGLPRFDAEMGKHGRYAYVVDNGNIPQFRDATPDMALARKTDLLSNLVALSYFPSKGAEIDGQVWTYVKNTYAAGNADDDASLSPPHAPSERWLIAANRVAPADAQAIREKVLCNVAGYSGTTDIGRFGMTILALIDGPARFPNLVIDTVRPTVKVVSPADKTTQR